MEKLKKDMLRKDAEENKEDASKERKIGKFTRFKETLLVAGFAGLMMVGTARCSDVNLDNHVPIPPQDQTDGGTTDADTVDAGPTDGDVDIDVDGSPDADTVDAGPTDGDADADLDGSDADVVEDGGDGDGNVDADADAPDGGVVDGDVDEDGGLTDGDADVDVDGGEVDGDTPDGGVVDGDVDADGGVTDGGDSGVPDPLCPTAYEDDWTGIMYFGGSTETVGDYVFQYMGEDATTGGAVFRITCADGTVVRESATFDEFGESIVEIPEDGMQVRYDSDGATAASTGGTIYVEFIPSSEDGGPVDADGGVPDADVDAGDADAGPTCIVVTPLCSGVAGASWEGIMYVEGHPWASTENIGDYYFDYLGPDPTTAGPTFRISCADGTVARAEAVFAQFGPSSVEITEDCIRVNMDSDGATVNATGGRINTEAM